MGRIKTKQIKRLTQRFIREHKGEISSDFTGNKKVVDQFAEIRSKKLRNTIAGYVTRLSKTEE